MKYTMHCDMSSLFQIKRKRGEVGRDMFQGSYSCIQTSIYEWYKENGNSDKVV